MDFRNFLSASGKISLTKTKNRETRAQRLHQWWKNRYFLLLFSSSSVTTGSSIVPVENATTWYPEKKRKKKKKEVRRIRGIRALQNALDAFTSWLIHSFLTVSISFIWLWNSSKSRNQKSSRKEDDSTRKNKFRTCSYVSYMRFRFSEN